jgi:hypothetical protein
MDLIMRFARRILRSLGTGPRLHLRNGPPDGADRDAEDPGTLGLALSAWSGARKPGPAEQWSNEGNAVKMTRLSCHHFRSNKVRLWLSVIAYNLGNLWRRLVLQRRIGNWSLTNLQQGLVKTGGRLVKHARYY